MSEKKNPFNISKEELRKMSEVDIRTVNPEELVDIKDVLINTELPHEERIADFIRQVKNPYCYLCNGMIIKTSFTGKRKLEDCLKAAMFSE